jgi:hypothetical protein
MSYPAQERSERRPSELFLADLADVSALAERLDVISPVEDFDVGLKTENMPASRWYGVSSRSSERYRGSC